MYPGESGGFPLFGRAVRPSATFSMPQKRAGGFRKCVRQNKAGARSLLAQPFHGDAHGRGMIDDFRLDQLNLFICSFSHGKDQDLPVHPQHSTRILQDNQIDARTTDCNF